jgi:hypothetical protein
LARPGPHLLRDAIYVVVDVGVIDDGGRSGAGDFVEGRRFDVGDDTSGWRCRTDARRDCKGFRH